MADWSIFSSHSFLLLAAAIKQLDAATYWLMGVVLSILGIAFVVGRILRKQPEGTVNPAVARMFNLRIKAWWAMCAILIAGIFLDQIGTVILFGFVSFWALREFITMTNTRRGDHRALFWAFFAITPVQYWLTGTTWEESWQYELFLVFVPLVAAIFIPARIAFSGDPKRFLERSAKIQAGLIICVYALSHVPALLNLEIVERVDRKPWHGHFGLLFYFIVIVQLGDVFQYGWGKLLGRRVIGPRINETRTWEGFFGGVLSTALMGMLLKFVTPFQLWEAACISTLTAVAGSAGGMTMSAIKRDRGVMDYGTLVQGHAGVLDRIDSICFAAPVFFHLIRRFYT